MPHSDRSSADSNSTHSSERMGPMSPASPTHSASTLPSSVQTSQTSTLKRQRSSVPGNDVYASLIGTNTEFDEFLQKHLRGEESMTGTYNNPSQQRKQYYEEQFQYKDNAHGGVRERIQRESPVIAELRTNVIIKDEFTLVTDLSYHLAARYTRPDSAIMVKVDHSACLAMGGTFDPCYILTVTTVPSQMGPIMNKRNAALIQSFMADILSVPSERGIVKFTSIPEENFATNGTTIAGEIERQEKQQSGANDSTIRRAITSSGRKSMPSFKKSLPRIDKEAKHGEGKTSSSSESRHMSGKVSEAANSHSRATTPPAALPPVGVFELPGDMDKNRPATANAHSSSAVSNGLRMNGVSSKSFSPRNSGTPTSRPRTISGSSLQEQTKDSAAALSSAPPPPAVRLRTTSPSRRERSPSFLKIDPTKLMRPTTPKQRQSGSVLEDRSCPNDSRADKGMRSSTVLSGDADERATEEQGEKDKQNKKDPAANTAKRRSTITATPKMPNPHLTPSTNEDKKSTRSMRIGKRKSFLSAFRRSTPPAAASG